MFNCVSRIAPAVGKMVGHAVYDNVSGDELSVAWSKPTAAHWDWLSHLLRPLILLTAGAIRSISTRRHAALATGTTARSIADRCQSCFRELSCLPATSGRHLLRAVAVS